MLTNIRYILLTALRDWLFGGLLVGLAFAVYISITMGGMAMVEPEQMKVTYTAASTRMIIVVGLIVFVCFQVRHAFDSKEIDVFLSRPISRFNLVLSYWLGFSLVALLLVIPVIAVVWWVGVIAQEGFFPWAITLLLESLLVVAAALFSAFTLRSGVTAVMSSLGFYVLSRMMGFFIATSQSSLLFREEEMNVVARFLMEHLAILVPRLDFFAKSEWLIYGLPDASDLTRPVVQAFIFTALLIMATVIDFRRKQF